MKISAVTFIIAFLFAQRLARFSKINNFKKWEKWFGYARIFTVALFMAEVFFSVFFEIRWLWHVFFVSILIFVLQQKEFRPLRMFVMAFVPYVAVTFIDDLFQLFVPAFHDQYETYFQTASSLAIIWLIAILFSQYKQNKAAEKERIKREKEAEINRAIAIRKVELEGLVVERTAEITKQKEELEKTLEELKATQSQLIQSEKMASLGELTAGIAHEIQNPLNFVNNFSEVSSELIDEMKEELEKKNTGEVMAIAADIKQNLEKIIHHGKRADGIVKAMLQHSRSSSGVKEPTDINVLADEYLRLAYHGLRAKDKSFNATLKTDLDEKLGKIDVVPQEMGRVILNLLTNAFYAVHEKKKTHQSSAGGAYEPVVTLKTSFIPSSTGTGGTCLINVTDNGNGIPPDTLDKIFQPFFTTKPSGKGTGLGLSMSYEIVTKGHGGQLTVENNKDGGASFTILLPVKK